MADQQSGTMKNPSFRLDHNHFDAKLQVKQSPSSIELLCLLLQPFLLSHLGT